MRQRGEMLARWESRNRSNANSQARWSPERGRLHRRRCCRASWLLSTECSPPEPVLQIPATRSRVIPVAETLLDGNELRYVTECIESNWVSSEGPVCPKIRGGVCPGRRLPFRRCLQ